MGKKVEDSNQDFLWCEKCKKYPLIIQEEYAHIPVIETREWNDKTGLFEIVDTNMADEGIINRCGSCNSKLKLIVENLE